MRRGATSDTFEQYVSKGPGGCWEWTGFISRAGYGRYREQEAHRAAYERENGAIPPGLFVCHSCDNPACVNPAHLWLGTAGDNSRDMVAKGRARHPKWAGRRRGTANPNARLTPEQVLEIRSLRWKKTQREIAERFGISQGHVNAIMHERNWGS